MPEGVWNIWGVESGAVIPWLVVLVAGLLAALTDLAARRIPNSLTVPLWGSGLLFACWNGGAVGLGEALMGCALLAMPFIVLFVFADGGAGDAKLMGGVGAWLGVSQALYVLPVVVVVGALLGIGTALMRRRMASVVGNLTRMGEVLLMFAASRGKAFRASGLLPRTSTMTTVPYGVAIFAGLCIAAGGFLIWRT